MCLEYDGMQAYPYVYKSSSLDFFSFVFFSYLFINYPADDF